MLTLAAAIGWNLFQDQLMRAAFVPSAPFTPLPATGAPDYSKAAAWLSRPDLADDPSRWTAPGFPMAANPQVAVFYIPPTTYLSRRQWNAPIDDPEANGRLRLFASSQASAFNGIGAIWAPRYRQASIGAFLVAGANPQAALEFAYADVLRAWDAFIAQIPKNRPILIAGHSQGSLHLVHLLRDRVAGQPVAKRIVAAYAAGWPISIARGSARASACRAARPPDQANCILSWQTYRRTCRAAPAARHLQPVRQRLDGRTASGHADAVRQPAHRHGGRGRPGAARTSARSCRRPELAGARRSCLARRGRAVFSPEGLLLIGQRIRSGYGAVRAARTATIHVFDYALVLGEHAGGCGAAHR